MTELDSDTRIDLGDWMCPECKFGWIRFEKIESDFGDKKTQLIIGSGRSEEYGQLK